MFTVFWRFWWQHISFHHWYDHADSQTSDTLGVIYMYKDWVKIVILVLWTSTYMLWSLHLYTYSSWWKHFCIDSQILLLILPITWSLCLASPHFALSTFILSKRCMSLVCWNLLFCWTPHEAFMKFAHICLSLTGIWNMYSNPTEAIVYIWIFCGYGTFKRSWMAWLLNKLLIIKIFCY